MQFISPMVSYSISSSSSELFECMLNNMMIITNTNIIAAAIPINMNLEFFLFFLSKFFFFLLFFLFNEIFGFKY